MEKKDDYNERVAKRLSAKRIITKDPVFYREFVIHKTDCDEFVANYIFADAKALLMALADQDLLPKHITKFVIECL